MTWMGRRHKRELNWSPTPDLRATLAPLAEEELAAVWQRVETEADGSVFQSWTWVGCRFAARFDKALILRVMAGPRCVAIGVVNRRTRWGVPHWYVGETGEDSADSVFVEYNGPLVVRDCPEAREAWFAALLQARAGLGRIVVMSGIGAEDRDAACRSGVVATGIARKAPWRDLADLRRRGADCLDAVSGNTRQQIARAERRYAASGAIRVERATTIGQAREYLSGLATLHQASWQRRGRPGAFARDAFRGFHEDLVARGVAAGCTDLLRISAGARLIGYLYNLVWRGRVSAYQSGFAYEAAHPHEKPGLVCHVAAMRHYQAEGREVYDFLAGDDRYKTSLSGGYTVLHWVKAAPQFTLAGAFLAGHDRLAR